VSVDLQVSHYMPEDHGTHGDFIAPWARAVERHGAMPEAWDIYRAAVAMLGG